MILKLRQRMSQEESGFTLVELLVVMLILGILAAIAIPAFFNQSDKAKDADAKSAVKTEQTAIETWATDHGGVYNNPAPTAGDLKTIEETLNDAPNAADMSVVVSADKAYAVAVKSTTGTYFSINRATGGQTFLKCGKTLGADGIASGTTGGGCPPGNTWG